MKSKPKVGLYVDGANLFYQGRRNGWMIDYKKLLVWVRKESDIVVAKYFIGKPSWEPAKSLNQTFNSYLEKIGYSIITKPLKKIKTKGGEIKNKCNFDVEMHDEIIHDLSKLDIVYLVSGDSDFMRTKQRVLSNQKKIKFLAYKRGCSWEIRMSWHVLLDDIKAEVERT
ncbi:MAG: NYN domain-containing protein [Patescibacteria group bacterium]